MKIKRQISVLAMAAVLTMGTAAPACAQNISDIAKSDPLIITGAVGTQNTYRYTSEGNTYGSPLSNSIFANLNISIYGISMPFSFYYSNDNMSFSHPEFSFNLCPQYKNWTGYIGQSYMTMSGYVMTSSFNGIGVEYNDQERWRAGLFYGTLRRAINDDPSDPFARSPQYKRVAWGFKAGYGSSSNYIDLYVLRAYDSPNSLDESWRRYITPQENFVVGLKGVTSPLNWMSFSANLAASVYTSDTNAAEINGNTLGEMTAEDVEAMETPASSPLWHKVFTPRYTTSARFAGDANLSLMLGNVNANLSYRLIQPDYTSLGLSYMSNNYHSLAASASTILYRKVSLSGMFSFQADNLTNKQLYTTRGFVYNAMASTRLGKSFSISASYNGYTQNQSDGTAVVNDTLRLDRLMSSYSVTPSYSIDGTTFGHTIAATFNYTQNLDRNKIVQNKNDVTTLALGMNYVLDVKPWETSVTASFSHQETKGYQSKYITNVGTVDIGRSFLSEKNLHLSAGVNMCYNHVWLQSKSLTVGGQCSASLTLAKSHVFSASASFNKYGDVNMRDKESGLNNTDITCSLNYTYTFSLVELKSKAHKEEEKRAAEAEAALH